MDCGGGSGGEGARKPGAAAGARTLFAAPFTPLPEVGFFPALAGA